MNQEDFKAGLSRFGTGVTIITTTEPGGAACGFTATAFSSLSLQPPLILFSLARTASVFPIFETAPTFVVNILAGNQSALSDRFASKSVDRFDGVPFSSGQSGAPVLGGCLVNLECRTTGTFPGGDHLILVGEVEQVHLGKGAPLLYFAGRYGALAEPPRE